MKSKSLGLLVAGLLIGTVWSADAATFTIDNSAAINSSAQSFGSDTATATYGQTFTTNASDTVLEDFSLFLGNRSSGSGSLDLRGYLATWTGSRAGSILYTSATVTTSGNQQFTFAPGLSLLPNTTYVAFLSVSELAAQSLSSFSAPISSSSSIAGGGWVFSNNQTNFSALTSSNWITSQSGAYDLRFIANFSRVPSGVPEPGTLALLGLGLAGLGLSRRRKAH